MNEQNEIGGDLQDELQAILAAEAAEAEEAHEEAPEHELTEEDYDDWYQTLPDPDCPF